MKLEERLSPLFVEQELFQELRQQRQPVQAQKRLCHQLEEVVDLTLSTNR